MFLEDLKLFRFIYGTFKVSPSQDKKLRAYFNAKLETYRTALPGSVLFLKKLPEKRKDHYRELRKLLNERDFNDVKGIELTRAADILCGRIEARHEGHLPIRKDTIRKHLREEIYNS